MTGRAARGESSRRYHDNLSWWDPDCIRADTSAGPLGRGQGDMGSGSVEGVGIINIGMFTLVGQPSTGVFDVLQTYKYALQTRPATKQYLKANCTF